MSMNKEVFLSILAMDSYQRGYAAGIKGVDSVKIGNAKLITRESRGVDAPAYATWQNIGFFAQEYEWNGETVISYRGTDNLISDAASGYGVGAGIAGVPQGNLAIAFYQNVTGQYIFSPNVLGNVVLTGHSLGGGLAGLVSTLSGVEAIGFDYMPFASAANDNVNLERIAA